MSPSTGPVPEGTTGGGGRGALIGRRCHHQQPLVLPAHESQGRLPGRRVRSRSSVHGPPAGSGSGRKRPSPPRDPRAGGSTLPDLCRRRATTTGVAAGVIFEVPPRARRLTRPNGVSMTAVVRRRARRTSLHALAPDVRCRLRGARQPKPAERRAATARDRRSSDRPGVRRVRGIASHAARRSSRRRGDRCRCRHRRWAAIARWQPSPRAGAGADAQQATYRCTPGDPPRRPGRTPDAAASHGTASVPAELPAVSSSVSWTSRSRVLWAIRIRSRFTASDYTDGGRLPWGLVPYDAFRSRQRPTPGLPHPAVLRLQAFSAS